MREIKFRAWNKQSKKMVYYDKDCSAPDLTLNGVALHHSTGANVSYMYELMQFTGLKDKNGKEIYEGDIVQNVPFERPCDFYLIEHLVPPCENILAIQSNQEAFPEAWKVIGNIHQNPELMEQNNG